jgi:predicted Zn-dependent protease with MMP-like domain
MEARSLENLAGRALDALPEQVAERIADVAVIVEDEPPRRAVERHGVEGVLLGRYSGSPVTRCRVRGRGSISRMPDIIELYYGPIERVDGGDGARIAFLIDATLRRETSRDSRVSPGPDRDVDEA